jgi:membrane-associated phospholipid phosphatase
MLKVVMFWALSLAVLVGGAVVVCPNGQCALNDFDRIGLGLAHSLRTARLDRLMPWLTWLGSLLLLLPLAGVGAWFLYRGGRGREAGFMMLALLGSSALSHLVKLRVARPRPDLFAAWLPIPETWSYPSSHAMQGTAAAVALILVARSRGTAGAVLLGVAVLLVGLPRIYLQLHFPSDVIAGTLAAALWVAGLYALMFGGRPTKPR